MTLELDEDDVLLLPEVAVVPGYDPAPGAHTVIYSQGHYITFLGTADLDPYPGWATRPALWTVSRAGADILRRWCGAVRLAVGVADSRAGHRRAGRPGAGAARPARPG
jgi:hypothetical protein